MQVAALSQDDLFSKRFVYYFAAWSLFSMIYFIAVTFWPPPTDGLRIADTILGVLLASVIGVMFAYFYGTTRGQQGEGRNDQTAVRLVVEWRGAATSFCSAPPVAMLAARTRL